MTDIHNLRSFVADHERKLTAKIEATAVAGRLGVNYRHVDDESSGLFSLRHLRSVLEHKYLPHANARTWPMRYEITPRN